MQGSWLHNSWDLPSGPSDAEGNQIGVGLESFGVRQRSRSSTCMPFLNKEEPSRPGKMMFFFWVLLDWDAPFLRCQPGLLLVFMAASSYCPGGYSLASRLAILEGEVWLKMALWVVSLVKLALFFIKAASNCFRWMANRLGLFASQP